MYLAPRMKYSRSLFQALIDAQKKFGANYQIALDTERKFLRYKDLIQKSLILGKCLNEISKDSNKIGILLPNGLPNLVSFFALSAYGKIPAMLNFSSGAANIINACKTSQINQIISSKIFLEKYKISNLLDELNRNRIELLYLEDIKSQISTQDKMAGSLQASLINHINFLPELKPDDIAVILFTSGSESKPKGVALSHKNIQANIQQLISIFDYNPNQDFVFNTLPMFHAFGLTVGSILPLLTGVKTFYYSSPLHYKIIPELIHELKATVLYGTDTFLRGYAEHAPVEYFKDLKYVIAGAEKLKEDTRSIWQNKFGITILEGYGATESSPVLSINTIEANKSGTVGKLLKDIEYKLEEIPGIKNGYKLLVKGPNIMLGYFMNEKPGILQKLKDGWYDTKDIVQIDSEGFITILGRLRRFAKIGGEMVSLTAIEELASELWPNYIHAAISRNSEKKGEQVILFTSNLNATKEDFVNYINSIGLTSLMAPKEIKRIKSIPLLASGKINYQELESLN